MYVYLYRVLMMFGYRRIVSNWTVDNCTVKLYILIRSETKILQPKLGNSRPRPMSIKARYDSQIWSFTILYVSLLIILQCKLIGLERMFVGMCHCDSLFHYLICDWGFEFIKWDVEIVVATTKQHRIAERSLRSITWPWNSRSRSGLRTRKIVFVNK